MATLRIYDLTNRQLSVHLKDLLQLFLPQSLQLEWTVATVKSSIPGHTWFEATGEGGEQLASLAEDNMRITGSALAALAKNTRQVIWGEFIGYRPSQSD